MSIQLVPIKESGIWQENSIDKKILWKEKLGKDLDWGWSFEYLTKTDTTKHVHKLHPYKGKFIPQLVEYFLEKYFQKGDIILDPFVGSGTTLVQAQEMNIHSIGIDVALFNSFIGEVKLLKYDLCALEKEISDIKNKINIFAGAELKDFEDELNFTLNLFNNVFFTQKEFIEESYFKNKEKEFKRLYERLINKHQIILKQEKSENFLDLWYTRTARKEIDYALGLIRNIKNIRNKKILSVILSRTIRSCRATTHSDLIVLKTPQLIPYYCHKHKKICKPVFSIKNIFAKYADDTLIRLKIFDGKRSNAEYAIISADSRNVDIQKEVAKKNKKLSKLFNEQKIKGVFTSPPYVGQIDYHEQHAYAYDLFKIKRQDDLEIGSLSKGQGYAERKEYITDVSKVLLNCKKYLADDFDVFLVANDKHNLYPEIAKRSGMKIINKFKRPVLNKTENSKLPYSETIHHLKSMNYN